jgi:hypothetical protein
MAGRYLLVTCLVVIGAAVAYSLLPLRERVIVRRGGLRVVGEGAALALRLYDPWSLQRGAHPGGLPDSDFLATPAPDTGSVVHFASGGRPATTRVTGWASADTPTEPPFDFERWDEPGLVDLRRTYHLERLITRERPDFPSLLAATAWVAGRWRPGANAPPLATHFDAREVLRRAEQGEVFDCGSYAWTLIQVLASLGINGRLVELERADGQGHSVVETWCDELGKWVVLDPYTNVTFTLAGSPLDALELHRLWRAGRANQVRIVSPPGLDRPHGSPAEMLAFYEHFDVRMRNNLLSASYPRWHPKANRIMSAYEWAGDGPGRPFFRLQVRDSARLYFPLKLTAVRWRWDGRTAEGAAKLDIHLATCSANFDRFLVSRDGRQWTPTGPDLQVVPRSGRDTLRFAARNRSGRVGAASWIALETVSVPTSPLTVARRGAVLGVIP